MAPPGCDAWYVLVPVPNSRDAVRVAWQEGQEGIDWARIGPLFQERVLRRLEETVLPGLSGCVTEAFHVTPDDFRSRFLSLHGTGFSVQPLLSQSAWFRFHNRSEDVANLYLVGAGTHPGAGMPGVLCSAKVLDRIVPPAASVAREATA